MIDDVKSQNITIGRGQKDTIKIAFRRSLAVLLIKVLLKCQGQKTYCSGQEKELETKTGRPQVQTNFSRGIAMK